VLRFEYLGLVLVWGSIAASFCAMSTLVGVCWWRAAQWTSESPQVHSTPARLALQAFSLLMMAFVALFLCACVFLRRSINLAIKVVALAATAVESMMLLVFTPVLHLLGLACFVAPLLAYGFFIASSGKFTQLHTTCYPAVSASGVVVSGPACVPASNALTGAQRAAAVTIPTGLTYSLDDPYAAGEQLWFLFFCLLWTMNFIAGLGSLVIATAVATWYFTPFEDRPSVDSRTVVRAYGIVLKYHMGTAAFGGLLIGTAQFLRWVALYVEKHCKALQSNLVARTVFCCVDCCLCCLEKCLKFISKQCYIQTAIHGSSFCTGCKDAFFTVARNIFSVGAVSVVSGIALTIGKVFVTAVAGVSSYLFFQGYYQTQMYDDIACTVLVMILAWISSSVFSEVFHMAADTVIMCYITDSEQNEGVPQHAAQDMAEFLAEHGALTADHKRVTESGPGAAPGDTQTQAPSVPHAL
jgi:choline transporter-like protein 2/4/5